MEDLYVRYIICIDFIGISDIILDKLYEIKKTWTNIDNTGGLSNNINQQYVYSMYDDRNIEYKDISEFNFLYTNQQLKYINFAIGSISNMHDIYFLDKIKQFQMEYSIEWCIDNNIPIHNKLKKYEQPMENIYKSIITAINNNDEDFLKLYCESSKINKGKIQLLIYIYFQKKFHLLQYFIKNIRFSNLLYYLNSNQIIE